MIEEKLAYPVIITECNDESGHYYGVCSPNINGMVTDGKTIQEAIIHAEDAIATMISDEKEYPKIQDPANWKLEDNERIVWITVNMTKWLNKHN